MLPKTHFDFVVPMDLTHFAKELFLRFFEKVVIYPCKNSVFYQKEVIRKRVKSGLFLQTVQAELYGLSDDAATHTKT